MRSRKHVALISASTLFSWLLAFGCRSQPGHQPVQAPGSSNAGAIAERLRAIATNGTLPDLRWQNFSHYSQEVQKFYEAMNYAPVWVRNGGATPQALALIAALEDSARKGLTPEDYDASRWPLRLNGLKTASGNVDKIAGFDAALTVAAMRYLSDLRTGRVNPRHFEFSIDLDQKKYDLPQFLAQKLLTANDVPALLNEVEPQYYGYKRTQAALDTYIKLAAEDHSAPLPEVQKALNPGDAYTAVEQLTNRLQLRGDMPRTSALDSSVGVYDGALVEAVKHFQTRHGLRADGRLDTETMRQLNVPLSDRVMQLQDALERWRWLPPDYPILPVAVNVPGFVLRVFSSDHRIALRMHVVVGKALGHETPIFAEDMKYIVFRPYWNVPMSITRREIIPSLQRNGNYLTRKNMEITDQSGRVVTRGAVSAGVMAQLRTGKLLLRERPGPKNSLGLVKFIFPNRNNVYLHSTPAAQLFSQPRRDFSHGCIRVEKPTELAAWLLQDQPKWSLESVKAAMQSGPDDQQVNLSRPVPVVIVYLTAVVEENGEVYFFDDVYGLDRSLNAVLAKGQTYP